MLNDRMWGSLCRVIECGELYAEQQCVCQLYVEKQHVGQLHVEQQDVWYLYLEQKDAGQNNGVSGNCGATVCRANGVG